VIIPLVYWSAEVSTGLKVAPLAAAEIEASVSRTAKSVGDIEATTPTEVLTP
jgi:hypothetical protein